ncbi:hypothetical protein JCM13580A_41800 [Streptomyces drozdowiczii]
MRQWVAAWLLFRPRDVGWAVSRHGRTVERLYDGGCPRGTASKRNLTHSAGAWGAHGVISRAPKGI